MRVDRDDAQAVVNVEARAASGDGLNGLQLGANVLAPGGVGEALSLQQVAPGLYRATFSARDQGVYR